MPSRYEVPFHLNEYDTNGYVANLHSTIAVIVTHPWGPLGGNMYNNVVNAIVLYCQRIGLTTVRFNFAGSQFGRGYYQVEQIKYIAQQLLSGELFIHTNPDDDKDNNIINNNNDTSTTGSCPKGLSLPKYILLIGYSYGSLLAASASATIPECIGYISIAPPFGVQHWLLLFNSNYHLQQASKRKESYFQRLFLIGTNDNFTSESKFTSTIDQYFTSTSPKESSSVSSMSEASLPIASAAVLKDADHFFARREKDVMDVIGQWLTTTAYPNECRNDLNLLRSMEITNFHPNSSANLETDTGATSMLSSAALCSS
jgi:uncharacterized protein